jgi:hypothetical protein
MVGEFLRQIATALEANGIPYMLTGSLASSMYGVPRATNDIDIVIAPTRAQLITLVDMFRRVGFTVEREHAVAQLNKHGMFNVIDFKRGMKVDLIIRKEREFNVREFSRRKTHEIEDMRLTIATPEDVIVAKLEWAKASGSERQLRDAAGILQVQGERLDIEYIQECVGEFDLLEQWHAALEIARAG